MAKRCPWSSSRMPRKSRRDARRPSHAAPPSEAGQALGPHQVLEPHVDGQQEVVAAGQRAQHEAPQEHQRVGAALAARLQLGAQLQRRVARLQRTRFLRVRV